MLVILAEEEAPRTMDYLANISNAQRCDMQQKGYDFYQRYMATPEGVIAGIIESLEHLVKKYHIG